MNNDKKRTELAVPETKSRIEEIREHHTRIVRIEEKHLNFKDHISRNAALEYIEGVTFLLAHIDALEAALKRAGERSERLEAALRNILYARLGGHITTCAIGGGLIKASLC